MAELVFRYFKRFRADAAANLRRDDYLDLANPRGGEWVETDAADFWECYAAAQQANSLHQMPRKRYHVCGLTCFRTDYLEYCQIVL